MEVKVGDFGLATKLDFEAKAFLQATLFFN